MIGDSLSDAYANLNDEIHAHYPDEWERLPTEIQQQVMEALNKLDRAREAVDRYQSASPLRLVE